MSNCKSGVTFKQKETIGYVRPVDGKLPSAPFWCNWFGDTLKLDPAKMAVVREKTKEVHQIKRWTDIEILFEPFGV